MEESSSRFKRFLNLRGVETVQKKAPLDETPPPANADPSSRRSDPPPNLSQALRDIHEIDIDFDDDRVVDYFGLSRVESNPDADEFYAECSNPDTTEYKAKDYYRDRRYSRDPEDVSSGEHEVRQNIIESDDSDRRSEGSPPIELDSESDVDEFDEKEQEEDEEEEEAGNAESDIANGSLFSISSVLPADSQEGFKDWELHDHKTAGEILKNGNGGIYDPFRPELTVVDSTDPFTMSRLPPAAKYRDSLRLKHAGIRLVHQLENSRKYKNNLTVILRNQYLVTCSSSELIAYEFMKMNQLPNRNPVLRFDVRPSLTHTTDRLVSTWPYFPHTINFLKEGTFLGKSVLAACLDDGLIQIWYVDTIVEQIERFGKQKKNEFRVPSHIFGDQVLVEYTDSDGGTGMYYGNMHDLEEDEIPARSNRFFGLKIKPEFVIKMGSSCWGLDFASDNMIVASDNCQNITLFYYHEADERFYRSTTHQVLHNIPEVSFLSVTKNDGDVATGEELPTTVVKVCCASISGEIIIFQFEFNLNFGPLALDDYTTFRREKIFYVDPGTEILESLAVVSAGGNHPPTDEQRSLRFPRVNWKAPRVTHRVMLGEDCWTCKPIKSTYFKRVQSIRAMIGDPWLDENKEIKEILKESRILKLETDPIKSSDLGAGTNWQFFETPVLHLNEHAAENEVFESAQLTGIDDTYRRIRKGILLQQQQNQTMVKSMNGKKYKSQGAEREDTYFLAASTSKRLGLFRADTLFCAGATKKVFDVSIPFNDESKFSNRISITEVIPELSCFLALTQQGLVTVMRLCQHRGLYGMRQEHLFPNALSLALGYNGYRTITGLATRNMSPDSSLPRYFVYLTYSDGIVLTYELRLGDHDEIELTLQ